MGSSNCACAYAALPVEIRRGEILSHLANDFWALRALDRVSRWMRDDIDTRFALYVPKWIKSHYRFAVAWNEERRRIARHAIGELWLSQRIFDVYFMWIDKHLSLTFIDDDNSMSTRITPRVTLKTNGLSHWLWYYQEQHAAPTLEQLIDSRPELIMLRFSQEEKEKRYKQRWRAYLPMHASA